MAFEVDRLTTILATSKTQQDNNALYQTILGLINEARDEFVDIRAIVEGIISQIGTLGAVRFVSTDTSGAGATYILDDYVATNQPVVFKDIAGNAAANNITLTGTVDGVVNPVINTNFGVMRVYKNDIDGTFNEW